MSTMTKVSPNQGGLHRLTERRPLTVFLALGIGLAYLLATVWGLAYHGYIPGGNLHEVFGVAADEVTGVMLLLALLPAAVYVTKVTEGSEGVRALFRRAFRWRVHPGWWLTALLGLPVLTIGLAVAMGDEPRSTDLVPMLLSQAGLLLVNFVVINIWEETSWTGVMQTRLERRHNWFVAAWIVAVPFALVHLPLEFFLDQDVTVGLLGVAFMIYLVLGLFFRPLMAVFRRATGDSLLLVALMHSVFNRTNNENGIAADMVNGELRQLTMVIAVVVLTVVIALVFRGRLSKAYAIELEQRP
jgi:membrane protease YdiL (CAAX protease family)